MSYTINTHNLGSEFANKSGEYALDYGRGFLGLPGRLEMPRSSSKCKTKFGTCSVLHVFYTLEARAYVSGRAIKLSCRACFRN